MRYMLFFLFLLILPHSTFGQNPSTSFNKAFFENQIRYNKKPPLNYGRILGEIVLGGIGGIGLGYAGARIGGQSFECEGEDGFLCGLYGALIGASIGWMAGSTAGVYVVGNAGDERGSLMATLLGSLGGILIGTVISGALLQDDDESPMIFLTVPPISAAIVAAFAFNSSRRYRSISSSASGLIDIRDGRVRFNVPSIYLYQTRMDGKISRSVNLLWATFSL